MSKHHTNYAIMKKINIWLENEFKLTLINYFLFAFLTHKLKTLNYTS